MSDKTSEALDWVDDFIARCNGDDRGACSAVNTLRAALSQQQAPAAAPDGWKLVPVKPTIEMVEAGYEASLGQPDRSGHARAIEMFDAMLAAAPTALVPEAQEPIKLSDDTREFLQEWIGSALEDDDHDFARQLETLLGPLYTVPPAAKQPDHSGDSADMVWCACGDGYQADSYDAGFIHGSGMCQNCDAAIPAKDIQPDADDLVVWRITLPSGESCHFGTESMARAWGRGSGKVERIDLKARHVLELVAAELPDTVPVPRELLTKHLDEIGDYAWETYDEMRALLAGGTV